MIAASRVLSTAFLLLVTSAIASAAPVTWKFTGNFTGVYGSPQSGIDPLPSMNSPTEVDLTFDPLATLLSPSCPVGAGACVYSGASLKMSFTAPGCVTGICESDTPDTTTADVLNGGLVTRIRVLNDSANGDGIEFILTDISSNLWRVFLLSNDNGLWNQPTLPATLDPRLMAAGNTQFTVCDPSIPTRSCGYISGFPGADPNSPVQSTTRLDVRPLASVPEPASLALIGLGLVGVAASRRRKTG